MNNRSCLIVLRKTLHAFFLFAGKGKSNNGCNNSNKLSKNVYLHVSIKLYMAKQTEHMDTLFFFGDFSHV